MVCSKAMINVARKLQEAFGTPWFEGSFYGTSDMNMALRKFAEIIGDPSLTERTEALIAREEAKIDAALARLARQGERWIVSLKGHGEALIDQRPDGLAQLRDTFTIPPLNATPQSAWQQVEIDRLRELLTTAQPEQQQFQAVVPCELGTHIHTV